MRNEIYKTASKSWRAKKQRGLSWKDEQIHEAMLKEGKIQKRTKPKITQGELNL